MNILYFIIISSVSSFIGVQNDILHIFQTRRHTGCSISSLHMSSQHDVVVVGAAGGATENIFFKLQEMGLSVEAILDRKPSSPKLAKVTNVYFGDMSKDIYNINGLSKMSMLDVLAKKVVIAVEDLGDDSTPLMTDDEKKQRVTILNKLVKVLPPSTKKVICIADSSTEASKFELFFGAKGSSSLKKWCEETKIPFSLLKYGTLTGGVPGKEPLPFLGLPLIEPELHPSYVLRSVVLSQAINKYAQTELCTREMIAEVVARVIQRDVNIQTQVLSIAGNPPTEKEWDQLFARITASSDVELVRVEFGAIPKANALATWIADSWFPQALIEADAATVIKGARPVRALKISENSVRIIWEDLQPDLTVKSAGEHEIRIMNKGESPCLSVIRLSKGSLPGELQLMEKLVEGINTNVYKKQFCVPVEQ